jgi:hypothetical protein
MLAQALVKGVIDQVRQHERLIWSSQSLKATLFHYSWIRVKPGRTTLFKVVTQFEDNTPAWVHTRIIQSERLPCSDYFICNGIKGRLAVTLLQSTSGSLMTVSQTGLCCYLRVLLTFFDAVRMFVYMSLRQ